MRHLQYPIIRITICVVLGILLSNEFTSFDLSLALGITSVVFLGYLTGVFLFPNNKSQISILTYIVFICVGFSTHKLHNPLLHSTHYSHYVGETSVIKGRVIESLKSNQKYARFILEVDKIDNHLVFGKTILNLSLLNKTKIHIGDQLVFNTRLQSTQTKTHPSQFDYGAYLVQKNIFYQGWLSSDAILVLPEKDLHWRKKLGQVKEQITSSLARSGMDDSQITIIKALFFGEKQHLNPVLKAQYIDAGVMHILAISGLHLGILILFLHYVFKPIEQIKYGKEIKLAILFVTIWSFVLFAGMSPSVVRAATMFSFVSVGLYARGSSNTYNVLFSSMLLILLCSPKLLFDVGFQLSYAAVFSIVLIHPMLSSCWNPNYAVLRYVRDLISISISAQLGVLPLSLFYFHQFSGLFLAANLMVIPLVTLILFLGVPVLILSFFVEIPFLVQSMSFLIQALNTVVEYSTGFESLIFKQIFFSKAIALGCYLVGLATILVFKRTNFIRISFLMVTLLIVQISWLYDKKSVTNESIIFHIPKQSLLLDRVDKTIRYYQSQDSISAVVKQYANSIFDPVIKPIKLQNYIYVNHKKILRIDSAKVYIPNEKPDVLWLTQSAKINLERVIQQLKPAVIVADGSNNQYVLNHWKETCLKNNIPFHATLEKGYYCIK